MSQKGPKSPFSAIFTHFHPFSLFSPLLGYFGEKGEKEVFVVKYPEIGGFRGIWPEWPILAYSEAILSHMGSDWAKKGQNGPFYPYSPKGSEITLFGHFHPFSPLLGVFWVKGVKMGFWAKRGISVKMGFSGYMARMAYFGLF